MLQSYYIFPNFAKSILVLFHFAFANHYYFSYLCSVFQSVKFKQAHTEKADNYLLSISGKRTRRALNQATGMLSIRHQPINAMILFIKLSTNGRYIRISSSVTSTKSS